MVGMIRDARNASGDARVELARKGHLRDMRYALTTWRPSVCPTSLSRESELFPRLGTYINKLANLCRRGRAPLLGRLGAASE